MVDDVLETPQGEGREPEQQFSHIYSVHVYYGGEFRQIVTYDAGPAQLLVGQVLSHTLDPNWHGPSPVRVTSIPKHPGPSTEGRAFAEAALTQADAEEEAESG